MNMGGGDGRSSRSDSMRKLDVFNSISLDEYFTDANGDMSWAHEGGDDPEFAAFTAGNARRRRARVRAGDLRHDGGVLADGRRRCERSPKA